MPPSAGERKNKTNHQAKGWHLNTRQYNSWGDDVYTQNLSSLAEQILQTELCFYLRSNQIKLKQFWPIWCGALLTNSKMILHYILSDSFCWYYFCNKIQYKRYTIHTYNGKEKCSSKPLDTHCLDCSKTLRHNRQKLSLQVSCFNCVTKKCKDLKN